MAQCPVCNGNISDDFGLIECPTCAAPLLVHMDGRVEHSGAKEEKFDMNAVPEPEMPIGAQTSANFANEFPDPNTELAAISALPAEEPNPEFELEPVPEFAADPEPESESEPAPEPEPEPVAAEEVRLDDVFAMPEEPAAEVYSAPAAPAAGVAPTGSADLSDIARFGNSGISANDGSLRYNLFIAGIDTADVREAFREAITDRKLVWDIDQILRSLKNGEVTIQNVTPPKAYILISRLRNVPVQVRWEQYALSQAQT